MILNESYFMNEVDTKLECKKPLEAPTVLHEDYSSSMPTWLIRELTNNKLLRLKLASRGYDLANLEFVKLSRNEIPSSGFDPLFKDTDKQLVYLLRDEKSNVVYLPGITTEDVDVYIDPDDLTKSTKIKYLSKKQLIDLIILMGYIESSERGKTAEVRQQRRDDKKGYSVRGKGQHHVVHTHYPDKPDGRTDWNNPQYSWEWIMTRGQDKSGYELNPNKYKDMLDAADLHTYGRQFERYAKKMEMLRANIVEFISSVDVKKGTFGTWSRSISDVVRLFEDAMYEYKRLLDEVERILTHEDIDDTRKNEWIKDMFDGTSSYNSLASLRKNLENANSKLRELKQEHKVEESLDVTNSTDDKFLLLAREVGLNTDADIQQFLLEELQEGEDRLVAILRYREELITAGINIDSLTSNKSISEDLEDDNETDKYIKSLLKLIREIEADIDYIKTYAVREVGKGGVYDSMAELEETVEELEEEIRDLQAKIQEARTQKNSINN